MENLKSILKNVSDIVLIEQTEQKEKWERGECFNVFRVLGLSTSEVKLHSAFIAELLNPKGSHGLGEKPIRSFIDEIVRKERPSFDFDISSASVSVEYSIGEIDGDEGGRMDILIQDKNRQTIIIENKIYAGDQYLQLRRYNNYASKTAHLVSKQYILLYLTLEGNKASDYSIGNEAFEYYPISYRNDVIRWLESCLKSAALHPLVRETISQYINNLKEILLIMDENNAEKLLNILTAPENIGTTFAILEHTGDLYNKIRESFISQILNASKELGFEASCDEGVKTASNNNWIHIYNPEIRDVEFRIGVKSHTNYDGYRMCFVSLTRKKTKEDFRFWNNTNPLEEFPFGWTYLWGEDGETGRWWRWDDMATLKDMTNGKMLKFIKEQLIRIKEEKIFEKMNNLLE
jgi:hypothetical protein